MRIARLRREFPFRLLAIYVPTALGLGAWIWAAGKEAALELGPTPFESDAEGVYPVVLVVWSWVMGYLLASGILSTRTPSKLDPSLPISARRLWLPHVVIAILSGLSALGTLAGVVALANLVGGIRPLLQPGQWSILLHLASGMILTIGVCQTPAPSCHELPPTTRSITLWAAAAAAYLALTLVLGFLPRSFVLAPLGIGILLLVVTYRRLPAGFVVASKVLETGGARTPGRVVKEPDEPRPARHPIARSWLVTSAIWRSAMGGWAWVYLPVIAVHGFILADPAYEISFAFYFLTATMLASWTLLAMRGLHRIDPLPIPRGRILATLVAPPLVFVAIGIGLGAAVLPRIGKAAADVAFRPCASCVALHVPDPYWEIAWKGGIPEVRSGSGEGHTPVGHPLARGLRLRVFDPFEIPSDATADFAALQASRAVAKVYGASVPIARIRDRHLDTTDDGTVRLREDRPALLAGVPSSGSRAMAWVLFADILIAGLSWLLFSALTFRLARGVSGGTWRVAMLAGAFAILLTLGIGSIAAHTAGLVDLRALTRFVLILVRKAGEALPGGSLALLVLTCVSIFVAYAAFARAFRQAEFPVASPGR